MDTDLHLYARVALALAIGLLIGLERGFHSREEAEGARIAGLRTFGLIGLAGGLWALLGDVVSDWVLAAAAGFMGAALVAAYVVSARRHADIGATTEMAAFVTFALGAVAVRGDPQLAAAAAVIVTLLLGSKAQLHGLIQRIEREELMAVVKLLLISVVLLPVLPNKGYGPFGALNPYEIWWLVVLMASISFAGYVAVRVTGPARGIALTGLAGGLVSSTATTLNLARLAPARPDNAALLAVGVVLATLVMSFRIAVLAAVVAPRLLPLLALGLVAPVVVGGLAAWRLYRPAAGGAVAEVRFSNPFEFGMALKFGLILAAVLLGVEALNRWAGTGGIYAGAALAGLADVDAITLSLGRMSHGGLAPQVAAGGILVAAAVNAVSKAVLAAAVGGLAFAKRVAPILVLMGLATLGGLAAL